MVDTLQALAVPVGAVIAIASFAFNRSTKRLELLADLARDPIVKDPALRPLIEALYLQAVRLQFFPVPALLWLVAVLLVLMVLAGAVLVAAASTEFLSHRWNSGGLLVSGGLLYLGAAGWLYIRVAGKLENRDDRAKAWLKAREKELLEAHELLRPPTKAPEGAQIDDK